jgi:hypothetical protein
MTLPSELYDRAVELRESAGMAVRAIAKQLSISRGALRHSFDRDAVLPPGAELPIVYGPPIIQCRDGRVIRRFTPEEDRIITAKRKARVSLVKIGASLTPPRRHTAVLMRLRILARRQAIAEQGIEIEGRLAE